MRSELEELERVNPVAEDEGRMWALGEVGLEVKRRATEQSGAAVVSGRPVRHPLTPLTAFATGVVVAALAAIPLLVTSSDPGEVATMTPESILADGVVTETEVRAAGEAVEQCMRKRGASGAFSLDDDGDQGIFSQRGIQFDVPSEYETILDECRADHMGPPVEGDLTFEIEHTWDEQNQPTPSELFGFYDKIVQCTEEWTGQDFGDMTQDETGAISAQGEATRSRASSTAGAEYQSCLFEVSATERSGFPGGPILLADGSGLLVVPPGWMATHTELTPNDDSVNELIAVSTYRLEPGEVCERVPLGAVEAMSSKDLLVTVSEVETRGGENPRPGSFSSVVEGVDPDTSVYTCVSPETRGRLAVLDTLSFRGEGRTFSVLVAIGSDVPNGQERTVVDMLDSLDFDID